MRVTVMLIVALASGTVFAAEGSATAGKTLYGPTRIAGHGANGKGIIPGLVDLTKTYGPMEKSDEVLFKSINEGFQNPGSALAMPAKGGNPALTDQNIKDLLEYLRSAFGRRGHTVLWLRLSVRFGGSVAAG